VLVGREPLTVCAGTVCTCAHGTQAAAPLDGSTGCTPPTGYMDIEDDRRLGDSRRNTDGGQERRRYGTMFSVWKIRRVYHLTSLIPANHRGRATKRPPKLFAPSSSSDVASVADNPTDTRVSSEADLPPQTTGLCGQQSLLIGAPGCRVAVSDLGCHKFGRNALSQR
jgi:hypothetical protein